MPHNETSFALSKEGKLKAQQELETLVRDFNCITACILASPDGLLMGSCSLDNEIEVDAVAAMSSSIISLGDALAAQATHDDTHSSKAVVSEAERISIVTIYAGPLVLTSIGKADASMGTVLSRSRIVADNIAVIVSAESGGQEKTSIHFNPDVLLARVMDGAGK